MGLSGAPWSVLLPHPQSPGAAHLSLGATACLLAPARLACEFVLHAPLARVALPARGAGARRDELWRHTCFEVFVTAPAVPAYYEFNLAPSGDWAAYRFEGYRERMRPAALPAPPLITLAEAPGRLALSARLELAGLADLGDATQLRLALAAVIEDRGGALSYFALHHARAQPDFHDPEGFLLELTAP